jgi:phage terminase large subunit-like protein
MLSPELITTLRQLGQREKLRVVQLLVNDLAEPLSTPPTTEEEMLLPLVESGVIYYVESPHIESGFNELLEFIEAEKAKMNG